VQLTHGDIIAVGSLKLACLATPGHTNGCMSFYLPGAGARVGMVFTGRRAQLQAQLASTNKSPLTQGGGGANGRVGNGTNVAHQFEV
jgi:hypothetical protein